MKATTPTTAPVKFIGNFRIDQRTSLDALSGGDADVAFGGGQSRTHRKSARKRGLQREGLAPIDK
jgi:hypothetical protein